MTTATTEKEATGRPLVGVRAKKKTGMLTAGIIVIVGLEKSSKSTLAASSGAYVLNLDAGDSDHIEGRIDDILEETDGEGNLVTSKLNVFRQAFKAALANDEVKIIALDTFGTFIKLQAQEIAEAAGLTSILERKEGVNGYRLWDQLSARVEGFINVMRESGKLFIINAHCKAPELDDEKRVVIPAGIDTFKAPGVMLARRADLIGYAFKKEIGGKTEYRLTFQGGPLGAWGSRVEALNDKTVTLAKSNPWASLVAAAEGSTKTVAADEPAETKKSETKSRGKK